MRKLSFLNLVLVLVLITPVYGLEVDEKLTLRLVKASDSRKTILINRGIEDGLAKGDHAKFYLTTGVVARGVLIKASPTRSVWSLYRLVNADFIRDEQIMRLKITPAVKITKDESKMLVADDVPTRMTNKDPRDLGIPLADGAMDTDPGQVQKTTDMSQAQGQLGSQFLSQNIREKQKEVFGTVNFSSFSSSTAPDTGTSKYSSEESSLVLTVGSEFYFKNEKKWYSRISFLALLSVTRASVLAHEGASTSESTNEFGGGANWYPMTRPTKTYRFIPYGNVSFFMGSTKTNYKSGIEKSENTQVDETLSGSTVAYSAGAGVKYYIPNGYGLRMQLDYYMRGDAFGKDEAEVTWVKRKSGPRLNMGVSYRW